MMEEKTIRESEQLRILKNLISLQKDSWNKEYSLKEIVEAMKLKEEKEEEKEEENEQGNIKW